MVTRCPHVPEHVLFFLASSSGKELKGPPFGQTLAFRFLFPNGQMLLPMNFMHPVCTYRT